MWLPRYFLVLLVYWSVIKNHTKGEAISCGSQILPHGKECQAWYDHMKCENESILLRIGHCMTQSDGEGMYATQCPYFRLDGHIVVVEQDTEYIKLPNNVSEFNDYMCGPMNRKGLLCKDCIDGFSPSLTSVGYKCSNCTEVRYGIPLYLLQQFIPITVFYLIILIFRIHLASAPMTCLILYSQIIGINIFLNPMTQKYKILNRPLLGINAIFYGIWNLDFFQYILPPFCLSSNLHLTHLILISFFSSIYPFLLIILTWIFIQLHDRNFRLIVFMWRPFHRLFVKLRKGWDKRRDMIDVFASFFLLSFSKIAMHSLLILQCTRATRLGEDGNISCQNVMVYDPSIICVSNNTKYILFVLLAILGTLMFSLLPALLLMLYPIKIFRVCLKKCRMNSLALVTFVEKFHGCYKDGLNGGSDLRSFSGIYFVLRFTLPISIRVNKLIVGGNGLSLFFYTFLLLTVIVAFVRPYKRVYMNVFDTFLLANLTILSHLGLRGSFSGKEIQLLILLTLPTFLFGCLALYNISIILKMKQRLTSLGRLTMKCCSRQCTYRSQHKTVESTYTESEKNDSNEEKGQVLVPTTSIIDIKLYNSICQSQINS